MRILNGYKTTVWLTAYEINGLSTAILPLMDRETGTRHVPPRIAFEELQKGAADLARAESRGFTGCEAVFVGGTYDGLHERAVPNNGALDWGRGQNVTVRNFFRDGKLVPDDAWQADPPEAAWEAHGLRCRVIMTDAGHRCGYVRVDASHPWYRKGYDACLLGAECTVDAQQAADPDGYYSHFEHSLGDAVSVHGGVTFADEFSDDPDGWWFGFDCAHAGDASSPEYVEREREKYGRTFRGEGHHWTLDEVRAETARMAEQIASHAHSSVTA